MPRHVLQLSLILALFFGVMLEGRAFVQFAKFFSVSTAFSSPAVIPVTAATTDGVEYNIYSKILHHTDGRTLHRLGTTNTPFLYVGQFGIQTDPNGLHHMRARYYNPHLMRFLNADPIGFAGGSNWYSYAGNSPLLFIDPTGLCPSPDGGGVLFGLFPTWGDYFHQVGQVFLGYADAAVGTAQGMANMAIHPIDTAAGLYNAVRHPVDTYDGMVASFKQNTKTNRGIGKMIGNGLITVASASAAATTAKIASTASKTTAITRTAAAKTTAGRSTVATLAKYYPENNGFIGATQRKFLMPGEVIDRFGGSGYSRFFSPQGVTQAGRALPPGTAGQPLRSFQVLKPFEIEAGTVAPAFGEMGFGTQYLSPVRLEVLLKRGILGEL